MTLRPGAVDGMTFSKCVFENDCFKRLVTVDCGEVIVFWQPTVLLLKNGSPDMMCSTLSQRTGSC